MKMILKIEEKAAQLDDGLDGQQMELAPFNFHIEELNQYIRGQIVISFDAKRRITLDLFYDFSVCYEEILDSIVSAKNKTNGKGQIWFCEQGSDFYINYEIKDQLVDIEFKKGADIGHPNKKTNEFKATVDRLAYVEAWTFTFSEIILAFKERLNKNVKNPI